MRCYRVERWLSAYLDDEFDPKRRASLEAHLKGCKACSAELKRLKKHWQTLSEGDQVSPMPADLWGQILASLDDAESLPWHHRHRVRLLQAVCVAACVVLGFFGGARLSWKRPPGAGVSESVSLGERMMIAEAFDVTAFGLIEGKEGLLRCVPK